jgi:DNA gyrase subunit A
MIYHYMKFQEQVVTRRTQYDLERAKERLHILEGLRIALDNIDEVIELIKASPNAAVAKERLNARFALSDKQSQAILDMRLQRLTGLERDKIEEEYSELLKTVAYYESILADEKILLGIIRDEVLEIRRKFADERRTSIELASDDIDLDDVIQPEDMVITLTQFGYIKRMEMDNYRAQRRGGRGITAQTTREEDFVRDIFIANTHDQILFFTNMGRAFRIKCYLIPEAGRTAKGTPIVNLLQLRDGEKVTTMLRVTKEVEAKYLVLATREGLIKKTCVSEFENIRKGGLIAQNLNEGDEMIGVLLTEGDDEILVSTRQGKCIRFSEDDMRPMGRTAAGVKSIALTDGDSVVDVERVQKGAHVLCVTEKGLGKRTPEEEYPLQGRYGKGVITIKVTERTGELICLKMTDGDEDMMIIRDDGTAIRMNVNDVSIFGRNTQGVKLMRVDEGTRVVGVTLVPSAEEEEEEETSDANTPVGIEE